MPEIIPERPNSKLRRAVAFVKRRSRKDAQKKIDIAPQSA
jgi:hypothetical protein